MTNVYDLSGSRPTTTRYSLGDGVLDDERHHLLRAVDHEGEVLESFVTKTRDRKAALKFLKKAMQKHGQGSMATDGIAEIDLSGTKIAAFSSVDKPAGGFLLRLPDGKLATTRIADVFDNFDGDCIRGVNSDGSRKLRLRYATPALLGFRASFVT